MNMNHSIKRVCAFMIVLALAIGCAAISTAAAGVPTFTAGTAAGKPGETVTVDISVANNPGIVSLKLWIGYDAEALTLTAIEGKDFADVSFGPLTANPIAVNWDDVLNPNNKANGVIAQLTFTVSETAAPGETPITVTFDPEDVYDENFENVQFGTVNGVVTVKKKADTATASLTDTVEMNMNFDLDSYNKEVVSVTVTGPDANGVNGTAPIDTEFVKGTDIFPGADGRYLIDWPVAAAQITDPITVTVTYSDATTEEILTDYSVKAYLEAVKASTSNAQLIATCDAALQYGACAQKAFNYRTDSLAAVITTTASDWTPGDAEYNNVVTGTRAAAGLAKVTTSALIRDKVALRMYITLEAGSSIDDYTVTYTKAGGSPVAITPVATDVAGKYSLDITGIAAAEFGTNFTFTVTNNTLGASYTLQTSVLNYGKKVLDSEGYQKMKTLVCAMKAYYDAAVAYFA